MFSLINLISCVSTFLWIWVQYLILEMCYGCRSYKLVSRTVHLTQFWSRWETSMADKLVRKQSKLSVYLYVPNIIGGYSSFFCSCVCILKFIAWISCSYSRSPEAYLIAEVGTLRWFLKMIFELTCRLYKGSHEHCCLCSMLLK